MRKCKNCGVKFEPTYSSVQATCNFQCAMEYSKKKQEQEWKKTKKKWKEDLKTLKDYVSDTQKIVNKYIRLRDKDKGCVSCGRVLGDKFDAGHFFNANNHYSIRFSELNIHGQCVHCNQWLHGNLIPYREELINRIGIDNFYELEELSNTTRKYTKEELLLIQKEYKQKIKELNN